MAVITGTSVLAAPPALLAATGSRGSRGVAAFLSVTAMMSASGSRGSRGLATFSAANVVMGTGELDHDGLAPLVADPAGASVVGRRGHSGSATLVASVALARGRQFVEGVSDLNPNPMIVVGIGVRRPTITANFAADSAGAFAQGNVSNTAQFRASMAGFVAMGSVYRLVGTANLVASPATFTGVGGRSLARISANPATMVSSGKRGVRGTAVLVAAPATLSSSGAYTILFASGISTRFQLGGTFTLVVGSSQSLEVEAERAGRRRAFPSLVYVLNALRPSDVNTNQVPDNRWFLVDPLYVPAIGDGFFEQGAKADYVGYRSVNSPAVLIFRPPVVGEVIWAVPGNTLYRYERNSDTGQFRWSIYRSMPERSLLGQQVFDVYDPDQIYLYYARIWGAMQWRFAYDNSALLNQVDPTLCIEASLAPLAAQFGLKLDFDDSVEVRRAKVGSAVEVFKLKGTDAAVSTKLRAIGLSGSALEVWVNPEEVTNFTSAVLNRDGLPSSSPMGSGTKWSILPHNYIGGDPADYWGSPLQYMTGRLVIVVNERDGSPIDYPALSPAQIKALHDRVYRELRFDVLPAHVDIRHFATAVALPSAIAPAESISITDDLTII